jgi:dTDP-4-dehydrorhamnose 3,5-epimerase
MIFSETKFKDVYVIEPEPFIDERGMFTRVHCEKEFKVIGHEKPFVQINHSINKKKATFRGLHYQVPPFSEIKLIRCISGKVFDVVVDIRKESKTFLQYFGLELSEKNMKMLYIPEGFAHGFITMQNNTQLIYHHTSFYKPGHEAGLRYDDPKLKIVLPIEPQIITEKDKNHPLINSLFSGI